MEDKQTIHAHSVPVHELFHIRFHEPVSHGNTLSSQNARDLVKMGMAEDTENGYITTAKGRHVISEMVDYLNRKRVIAYDFPSVSITEDSKK